MRWSSGSARSGGGRDPVGVEVVGRRPTRPIIVYDQMSVANRGVIATARVNRPAIVHAIGRRVSRIAGLPPREVDRARAVPRRMSVTLTERSHRRRAGDDHGRTGCGADRLDPTAGPGSSRAAACSNAGIELLNHGLVCLAGRTPCQPSSAEQCKDGAGRFGVDVGEPVDVRHPHAMAPLTAPTPASSVSTRRGDISPPDSRCPGSAVTN